MIRTTDLWFAFFAFPEHEVAPFLVQSLLQNKPALDAASVGMLFCDSRGPVPLGAPITAG
jgi:hypothetical protein